MVGIIAGMEGLKVHPPCPLVFMSCRPSHSFDYRYCPSHFNSVPFGSVLCCFFMVRVRPFMSAASCSGRLCSGLF